MLNIEISEIIDMEGVAAVNISVEDGKYTVIVTHRNFTRLAKVTANTLRRAITKAKLESKKKIKKIRR